MDRVGRILHQYANLRTAQGRLDEAFELDVRALKHNSTVLGNKHQHTTDFRVAVATHCARQGKNDVAM